MGLGPCPMRTANERRPTHAIAATVREEFSIGLRRGDSVKKRTEAVANRAAQPPIASTPEVWAPAPMNTTPRRPNKARGRYPAWRTVA